MQKTYITTYSLYERLSLAILFIVMGSIVYLVFSPIRPMFDHNSAEKIADYLGRLGLIIFLLAMVLLVRRSEHLKKYTPVILGLLIMTIAVTMDRIFGIYLIDYLQISGSTVVDYALLKLNECIIVFSVVISLTLLTGGSLGSIYIQKGNLKLGLAIGLTTFLLAAAGSIPMASLFKAQNLTLDRIAGWLPWLLIFVLANGAQEELIFRALFLRKLEPFFGRFVSNCLIVFIFTLLHYGVGYTSSNAIFLAVVAPLALGWGYIMQKTNAIWASILFHAGMDIPIMLGIFSNL